MKYLILFALAISGCSTTSDYFKGCTDGVEGLKFQLRNEFMAEPDIAQYYCKTVERNRKTRETTPHK